jgi:hypothetical protein
VSQYFNYGQGSEQQYHLISAASTNATVVSAKAGQVFSVQAFNTNASARYLKFYDKATAPAVGTDAPCKVILVPGGSAGAGVAVALGGVSFQNGISFATTTGAADNDTSAVGSADLIINIDWK